MRSLRSRFYGIVLWMILMVVHHHFRPGGVRRLIELATPHLVAGWPEPVQSVVLATGEAPDPFWLGGLRAKLDPTPLQVLMRPAFGYTSELPLDGPSLRRQIKDGIIALLRQAGQDRCLLWAHNLGLGRNLCLARELALSTRNGVVSLMAHHHDWWFENRWHHFVAMGRAGFRGLRAIADAMLPGSPRICHVAVNQADARVLQNHFPGLAGWLPNPVERMPPPDPARVKRARAWLHRQVGENAPIWLVPCRLLRRKNIAEALLLTRWLRPQAWLVTTGGVSSAEEQAYGDALAAAAQRNGWRLRLGILQGDESQKPSVAELLAASEVILLTSLQEGFGFPYLEAAAAQRPLLARQLPSVSPDLARFGFEFPQSYQDLRIDPSLFDWTGEHSRQKKILAHGRKLMPRSAARLAGMPALLEAGDTPHPAPFSGLTLAAQLEVLAQPIERSWQRCARLNPFLGAWREQALADRLEASPWPDTAAGWLDGSVYARRFFELMPNSESRAPRPGAGHAAQAEFLRLKLRGENLYPLLWNSLV
jgi:hypothetical protein